MRIVSLEDNLHDISNPVLGENKKNVTFATMANWYKFQINLFELWIFLWFYACTKPKGRGQINPRQQNFYLIWNLLSLANHCKFKKKNLFELWFYTYIFLDDFMHVQSL